MRYIITGASGHIGNNLVRYINQIEPTAKVVVLTRRKIGVELDGTNCTQVLCDILSEDFLSSFITSDDIVVHLAGVIDLTDKKQDLLYSVNYLGAKTITDVCLKLNVKKYVYAGSVDGIYKPSDVLITEPDSYPTDNLIGGYAKTKALATGYVKDVISRNPDFNGAFVLPSAVIGENDFKPSAVGRVILNVISNKAEIGLKGGYNFVAVSDVVKAIYKLANSSIRDGFILSGESVDIKQFYGYINKVINRNAKPIILPAFVAKMAMPFVKILNKITLKALSDPHNYSNKKASDALGINFLSAEDSIKKATEWFVANKSLFDKK